MKPSSYCGSPSQATTVAVRRATISDTVSVGQSGARGRVREPQVWDFPTIAD
jgi:hypothetical protein